MKAGTILILTLMISVVICQDETERKQVIIGIGGIIVLGYIIEYIIIVLGLGGIIGLEYIIGYIIVLGLGGIIGLGYIIGVIYLVVTDEIGLGFFIFIIIIIVPCYSCIIRFIYLVDLLYLPIVVYPAAGLVVDAKGDHV